MLKEDTPRDRYEEIGAQLARAESGINWFLGDWYLFGERKWGDLEKTAKVFGLTVSKLKTCRWVSEKVVNRLTTLT